MPSSPAVPEGGFVVAKEAIEARRDVPSLKAKAAAAAVAVARPTMKSLTMTTIEAQGANRPTPVRSVTEPVVSFFSLLFHLVISFSVN